jgi:hypothetical protein
VKGGRNENVRKKLSFSFLFIRRYEVVKKWGGTFQIHVR